MPYYVYIIKSERLGAYYKGFSTDPVKRLIQHNAGETKSTQSGIPWKLVYAEECITKREALLREKNLKKATRERIESLLVHPKNILDRISTG